MTRHAVLVVNREQKWLAFVIKNFEVSSVDLDTPVSVLALPEHKADEAHLIKMEGNLKSWTISWKLVNSQIDLSNITNSGGTVGSSINVDGVAVTPGVNAIYSADEQKEYLEERFEGISIADAKDALILPTLGSRAVGDIRKFDVEKNKCALWQGN